MIVLCKVAECKYCSSSGFCHNNFLVLTPQGFCGRIYNNGGVVKPDWNSFTEEQQTQKEEEKDDIEKNN